MSSDIFVIGLSHHSTPLEIRERAAVPTEEVPSALTQLRERLPSSEVLFVSTCNRVEVYGATHQPSTCAQEVRQFFWQRTRQPVVDAHLYERHGSDAVRHAFRVASSLDSLVVGEPQILGQFKEAYELAKKSGSLGPILNRCFHRAFSVAKKVRTQTGIASGNVSVSSIAADLAKKIFSTLQGHRVLLIGAGEMAEGCARQLTAEGATLVVMNRNVERAADLVQRFMGRAVGFEQLATELVTADIVITSTSSTEPIIHKELMKDIVRARRRKPLFMIDIAVPRNIDASVSEMENVFLYNVDDLQSVARENLVARASYVPAAEQIVERETAEFEHWLASLDRTDTIVALRKHVEFTIRAELNRHASHGTLDAQSVDYLTASLTSKLLHTPLTELKREASQSEHPALVLAAQTLFGLPRTTSRPPIPSTQATNHRPPSHISTPPSTSATEPLADHSNEGHGDADSAQTDTRHDEPKDPTP